MISMLAYQLLLFCLCRASERSRHSHSKVDEVLILDKQTQYFIMFRRTSRKRGYLPSSPITALFVAFCIRSSLLCESVSLRVAKATSCDAACSHNRQDPIQNFVKTHYVCNNISIKTNFKQITRVEIRLTNLHNTQGETTFCA